MKFKFVSSNNSDDVFLFDNREIMIYLDTEQVIKEVFTLFLLMCQVNLEQWIIDCNLYV